MRMIHEDCLATIGVVGNKNHENIKIGKAGRSRWLGKRPKVRGVVMNPVDHPHGGGEGRTLVEDTLSHHGEHQLKVIKLGRKINCLTNLLLRGENNICQDL